MQKTCEHTGQRKNYLDFLRGNKLKFKQGVKDKGIKDTEIIDIIYMRVPN